MSITRYGAANTSFVINTRPIKEWSNEDEPIKIETMEDKRDVELHHGGGAVIIDRINEGAIVTVSTQPGSNDSAYFSGLYASGELLEAQLTTIGTGEKIILSGGVVTKLGDIGRAFKPSNDNYTMKFSKYLPKLGG